MKSSSNLDVSAAGADDGALPSDDALYDRMLANLLGCWTRTPEGPTGASIERVRGAVAAVFPAGPERLFSGTGMLEQDLNGSRAREAATTIARAYEVSGSTRSPLDAGVRTGGHRRDDPPRIPGRDRASDGDVAR